MLENTKTRDESRVFVERNDSSAAAPRCLTHAGVSNRGERPRIYHLNFIDTCT